MTEDTAREVRLISLVGLLSFAYGCVVIVFAISHKQLELLASVDVGGVVATIWMSAFAFVFCAYALDLMIRRRPSRPLLVMIGEMRAQVMHWDWLIARACIIISWFCLMVFFTPFKIMIGHVRGFPWDEALMRLDRLLFLGQDPWILTHAVFGGPLATFVLHMAYNMWFVMMWLSIVYFMLRPELVRLRAQYLVSFLLTWMLVGSAAAYLLGSAGPCFYERAFGDPHFRPLMDRLHRIDAELQAISSTFGVHGLRLQDMLWQSFASESGVFGGGISAMPSVHVSIAVLMACASWSVSARMGWILTLFALTIWIGSVHFGWHYALDGIVGAAMTLAIWRFSGWLVERLVMREAPAASLRPALAE